MSSSTTPPEGAKRAFVRPAPCAPRTATARVNRRICSTGGNFVSAHTANACVCAHTRKHNVCVHTIPQYIDIRAHTHVYAYVEAMPLDEARAHAREKNAQTGAARTRDNMHASVLLSHKETCTKKCTLSRKEPYTYKRRD